MNRMQQGALLGALVVGALACQGSPGAPEGSSGEETGVMPGLVLAGDECTCATVPTTPGHCGDPDGDGLIEGTNGPDVILGTVNREVIYGYFGDDLICGGGGDDDIIGGGGNDRIRGNDGHDLLSMDGGNDTGEGGLGFDDLHGDNGYDRCFGGPDVDQIKPTCEVSDDNAPPPCEGEC